MNFSRTKIISKLQELLLTGEHQIIGVRYTYEYLLLNLFQQEVLGLSDSYNQAITSPEILGSVDPTDEDSVYIIRDDIHSLSDYRTVIEQKTITNKIIYCATQIESPSDIDIIDLGEITFREYREYLGYSFQTGDLLQHRVNIEEINELRDAYMNLGSREENLANPSGVSENFHNKIAVIESQLFEKEFGIFREFLTNLALGVGDLYKEERIAKEMNISRRKVRKYTELLLEAGMIRAIGPFVEQKETEMSRHVKVYFEDIADYATILGTTYGQGFSKKGVIENFVLHELRKKLDTTYDIRFYKKKSGAEIPFVLIQRETGTLIPIDIHIRSTGSISQALKTFYESYGSRIEYSMVLNESIAEQKEWNGSRVLILPTIAI